MQFLQNYDLTKLNTFGIKAKTSFYVELKNEEDIFELFSSTEFKNNSKLFLGGGSNVLFTKDYDGIVILNKIKGIEILEENEQSVLIRAMSGEIWHDLVIFAVGRGYWGIENLSLIPGTVGAAPMQNIGAYGAELKDVIESVETYNIETGAERVFTNEECKFGYRESVFKNELKGKYFIVSITIRLSKTEKRNISYKVLQEYLKQNKIEIKNVKDISMAVAQIRRSKLPDPAILGNAGSFFKNIFVEKEKLIELLKMYPTLPHYEEDNLFKIPSGWLIEQCCWKGKRVGNVGMHENQALVLVNYGGATGKEIKDFAEEIINSVFLKFGLKLSPEVNLI